MKWTPKHGQYYYYISADGDVVRTQNLGIWFDEAVIKIGNCFRTKKQAEVVRDKFIKLLEEE